MSRFEIKVRPEDKDRFLEYLEKQSGPAVCEQKHPTDVCCHDPRFLPYFDDVGFRPVILCADVRTYAEARFSDLLSEASCELGIPLRFHVFHQNGDGETRCYCEHDYCGYAEVDRTQFGHIWAPVCQKHGSHAEHAGIMFSYYGEYRLVPYHEAFAGTPAFHPEMTAVWNDPEYTEHQKNNSVCSL